MFGVVWGLFVMVMISRSCSGQTLQCFHCELGFWDMCLTTKENCSDGEQCFVGLGITASVLKIKMMGCLAKDDCNKTTVLTFPENKTFYNMTKNCCAESFCNGGPVIIMAPYTLTLVIAQIVGLTLITTL